MSHDSKSIKRDREDAEPTAVPSPFENLRKRFFEIDAHIARFQTVYDENSTKISKNNMRAQQRAVELKSGMFTPAVESPAELYINAVEMLFEQSVIINKAYELNSDINAYLKTASPDESTRLAEYKKALDNFILFIGQEVNVFFRIYEASNDKFLKASVKRALQENPPLQVWLATFETVQGQDPLVVAVTNEVNRMRNNAVEGLKGAFDAEVSVKLKELAPKIDVMLDQTESFEQECVEREFQCYRDEVAFYAEYCVKTLAGILDLLDELRILDDISDRCIRDIRKLDHTADISQMMSTFDKVRKWQGILDDEKNSIYDPMAALVSVYGQHGKTLSDKLKAFMKPWLDKDHPSPIKASIYAYQNPEYFPESHPVISETKPGPQKFPRV